MYITRGKSLRCSLFSPCFANSEWLYVHFSKPRKCSPWHLECISDNHAQKFLLKFWNFFFEARNNWWNFILFFNFFVSPKIFPWTRRMQFWQPYLKFLAQSRKKFWSSKVLVSSKKLLKLFPLTSRIECWENQYRSNVALMVPRQGLLAPWVAFVFLEIFGQFVSAQFLTQHRQKILQRCCASGFFLRILYIWKKLSTQPHCFLPDVCQLIMPYVGRKIGHFLSVQIFFIKIQ